MTEPSAVVRLSDPGSLVAAVPVITGYRPTQSLVAMSLRGPRRRLGLTMRADLDPALDDEHFVAHAVGCLVSDGALAAALVVFSEDGDVDAALPWRGLVGALADALTDAGVDVMEQLCVRRGRWFSYSCLRSCCPSGGTPLPRGTSALEAQAVLEGRVVLPDRAALVASLAGPPPGSLVARLRAERLQALRRPSPRLDPVVPGGADRGRRVAARFHELMTALADGPVQLDDEVLLPLLADLDDRCVRDAVLSTLSDAHLPAAIELLSLLVRTAVGPWVVTPATMLGWCAWRHGGGALANIAVDRALAADPDCALAGHLALAMRFAVRPGPDLGLGLCHPPEDASPRGHRPQAGRRRRRAG